jgi:ABC-2 type transport system permease protein
MNRTLLIARREYAAYAKTVGFWLSLLAFPLFAVLGGAVPILIRSSEPVRVVAVIEEGPQATGLAAAVQDSLRRDAERRQEREREALRAAEKSTGMPGAGGAAAKGALASLSGPRLRIVETPAEIATAAPGKARDDVVRRFLTDAAPEGGKLDAVVFLYRDQKGPAARVWSARATDDRVEDFIRDALRAANRKVVFEGAGIDPTVVEAAEKFRPEIDLFSAKSSGDGAVSFRDRAPVIIGLVGGFLLWSLVITGASILLNSVMEEKANKILEVLLSSASPMEILTGKVLGVAMLTVTVLIGWGSIGAFGLIAAAPKEAADIAAVMLNGGLIGWFAAFMVGGYLMYAVLFAAIGAFCETPRDAQTLMGPIMMILVIPMMTMTMTMTAPNAPAVKILSMIPFFTPFLMMARLPHDPPMIELIGSIVGMFAFALLMVWVSGRAFRAGALSDVKLSWKSFGAAIRGGGN